jgi:hypothetical protein
MQDAMERRVVIAHRRIPAKFLAAMGLCLAWFVPIGWLAYWGRVDTVLTMLLVTVFTVVALGVPWLLFRVSRGGLDETSRHRPAQWLHGQFETLTGRMPSREALVLILLPLASAAIGITLMGIVLGIVAAGG